MNNKSNSTAEKETKKPEYTPVCRGVLDRISDESITPRSRMFFQTKECVVWSVWFFAVLFGAVSLTVLLFIGGTVSYDPYFSNYSNVWTIVLLALPLLWLIVLISTVYLAYVNVRHTRYGYRYRTATVLLGGGVLTLLIGIAFEQQEYGVYVDTVLGETVPGYTAYSEKVQQSWHQPEKSWYTGTLVLNESHEDGGNGDQYMLETREGERYMLDISDVSAEMQAELMTLTGQNIRMVATSTGPGGLLVCDVLPVVMSKRSNMRVVKTAEDCQPE